jgi:hypothetical protein
MARSKSIRLAHSEHRSSQESPERRRDAEACPQHRGNNLPRRKCERHRMAPAFSQQPQHGLVQDERQPGGWSLQRVGLGWLRADCGFPLAASEPAPTSLIEMSAAPTCGRAPSPGEQFRPDGHYLRSACFCVLGPSERRPLSPDTPPPEQKSLQA